MTAMVGMIDASEQVPTFGAREKDVRAFISGGWESLGLYTALGEQAGNSGLPAVSLEHFLDRVLPTAQTADLVVLLSSAEGPYPLPSSDLCMKMGVLKDKLDFQFITVEVKP
jgi:N-acetylmuramic acid 6-phosphate (MurNAc-6-P) etherase